MRWNTSTDELTLSMREIALVAQGTTPSKRHVVSTVSRVYDPLGILAPVLISFKIYFQKLCKKKVTCDEPLRELLKEWLGLVNKVAIEETINIPRCFHSSTGADDKPVASLYSFCDVSLRAYTAVVYVVIDTEADRVACLACAKTRVAPLKE